MNINRFTQRIRTLLASACLALILPLGVATPALAAAPAFTAAAGAPLAIAEGPDVVKTKDGRTFEGTIVREVNGYVWIDLGVGDPLMLRPDQIESIDRDADTEVTSDPVTGDAKAQTWERREGVTRAAVLTCEGTVGMQMSSTPLRQAIPLLKEEGVDLVVIKTNSGGGLVLEVQRISDVLHNEFKPEFQMVAWVESAISAAAMSTIAIEEQYFMPRANFGAATAWSGGLQAAGGRSLESYLYMMEQLSRRGNKDPRIMRAMQINAALSYDIEPDGTRRFYESTEGDYVLNNGEDILTLNAETAEHAGFTQGTAGTLAELTRMLERSIGEIEWVGEKVAGEPFPICKAERLQREWRDEVTRQENRFGQIFTQYEMELGNAASVPVESRGGFLRKAGRYLAQIRKMYDDNPNFGLMRGLEDEWFLEQERRIEDLRR